MKKDGKKNRFLADLASAESGMARICLDVSRLLSSAGLCVTRRSSIERLDKELSILETTVSKLKGRLIALERIRRSPSPTVWLATAGSSKEQHFPGHRDASPLFSTSPVYENLVLPATTIYPKKGNMSQAPTKKSNEHHEFIKSSPESRLSAAVRMAGAMKRTKKSLSQTSLSQSSSPVSSSSTGTTRALGTLYTTLRLEWAEKEKKKLENTVSELKRKYIGVKKLNTALKQEKRENALLVRNSTTAKLNPNSFLNRHKLIG